MTGHLLRRSVVPISKMAARGGTWASGQEEEWQMARRWLLNTRILPPNHRAADPNVTLFDLAQSLRDGVVICQIANFLQPNVVRDVNMKPQMSQFLCLKNIRAFLHACVEYFGLSEDDLFDANELYDVSEFKKVIYTLMKLSQTPQALALGLEPIPRLIRRRARSSDERHFPFPPDNNRYVDYQDEDIYSNLEEIAMNRDIVDEENPYDTVTIEDDYKIYEDICSMNIPQKRPSRQSSLEEKRKYVVEELVQTEKSYVEALDMICKHFMNPLSSMISREDKNIIFINIEELLIIHEKLLMRLERAVESDTPIISEVFIEKRTDLVKYGEYCTRMQEAQQKIDEISKESTKFRDKLEECKKKAACKFALRSLLVIPFQRVLKYPLLIQELSKQTKSSHADKKGLEKALAVIQDVASYINQVKRDEENIKLIKDIQASLSSEVSGDLFKFGHLMKDGELQIKTSDQPPKKRHAFLLDRALLICKTKGDVYHHKQTMYLEHFEVQENVSVPGKGKFSHGWNMKAETVELERHSCLMFAKTADMKSKWISDTRRAIENLTLRGYNQGNHKFELHSFARATYCAVCGNLLWGLISQGYKCTICDTTAHRDCIAKSVACRARPGFNQFLGGTSPFHPRPSHARQLKHSASTSTPPSLSPVFDRRERKISAPGRLRHPSYVVRCSAGFSGMAPGGRPSLNLSVGDEVEVYHHSDPEWWEGRSLRTGGIGFFPRTHVVLKDNRDDADDALTRRQTEPRRSRRGQGYEDNQIREEPRHSSPPPANLSEQLSHSDWFAGTLERAAAELELDNKTDGTFLVRESVNRRGEYALSVQYRGSTKHIKIPFEDGTFCLTQVKLFLSIPELIKYYRTNTLGVSFPGLDTCLRYGIKEDQKPKGLGWAKALYNYNARNPKEITMQKNAKILILNNDGDWWKGECEGQVGYFPSNYVEKLKDE